MTFQTGKAVSLLIPSDAIWRGTTCYVLWPLYHSAEERMSFSRQHSPVTPTVT
jgi:hypothetical protein